MKIAYILPSIIKKGPVIVIQDLVIEMVKNGHTCIVYYFDELDKDNYIDFCCPVKRISIDKAIDFTEYDVIHSNMYRPDKYIAKYREYSGKVLYVSTIHCYIFKVLQDSYNWVVSQVFGRKWLSTLKSFDKVAVLSEDAKRYYTKWLIPEKLVVIYNARLVDTNAELNIGELSELLKFKQDSILIGINANLLKIKGIDIIIKALPFLPNHKLFVVGDGPKRSYFEKLAKSLGVNHKCYFAGYKPEAYRYLKHYDIYASPSRSEGFPLSVIEAAFYSKPLVVSDLPIFHEIFEPNQRAMFNLKKPYSVIEAILEASGNIEMGFNVRCQYDNKFSVTKFYKKYINLYYKQR